MQHSQPKKENSRTAGFTLLEILIAMAITVGIGILITMFAGDLTDYNLRFQRSLTGQQQAQQTLEVMMPELRSAAESETGSYPLTEAATSAITFYSDVDADGKTDQVRYYLEGTTFKKSVVKPTGNPLVYTTSSEVVTTLVDNMAMGTSSIFFYYGIGATSTASTPLAQPVNGVEIKMIRVFLQFNQGSSSTPSIVGVENQATIRNLRYE